MSDDGLADWEQVMLTEQFEQDRLAAVAERHHRHLLWAWVIAFVLWGAALAHWPNLRIYLGSSAYLAYFVGKHAGWLRRHRKGPTS